MKMTLDKDLLRASLSRVSNSYLPVGKASRVLDS